MSAVHVVVPAGIHDPARISGGNRYDREVCADLRDAGWSVTEVAAGGSWPRPDAIAQAALARSLDALPDDALVLADGLVASAAGAVLVPRSERLRLVVLVHMVFGGMDLGGRDLDGVAVEERDESAVLAAARAVVTTSAWTRRRLLERYQLPVDRVHVARPGTEPAPVSPRTAGGGRLVCVGTLSRLKGQDLLLEALGRLVGLPWRCAMVGPLDRDPGFVASLARGATATGIADRVRMPGTRTGAALRREYEDADLLVLPSRAETFGMVVPEALAAGVPVLATEVGGVREALGRTAAGRPGLLVPPEDPAALAGALARWLTDAGLRSRLRRAALRRRETLPDWRRTGERIRSVLSAVRLEPGPPQIRGVP
ncbi:glycosyltransferase family 4 protein [Geodermatophilus sabuli]|uniref:glycosyltransferase family 4 protein n=1 Tax=Geodermatophilus sabuli TaxID=1564158 RepID=UPI000BE303AC|nr:glycosyltransferase family 4 protein [Geodermatophilus sabuli]MBB3084018.1 glycosyltransferase involved in cell wall biosynthesis [Geodermatophilus sabuli]